MDQKHDSTETRTKLADAINSVVVMSEYETDGMVDAILNTLEPKASDEGNGADTAMSSQTTLRSHQIACEALSVEECLRRLKRHDWLAYAEDEDWTLQQRDRSVKGLQYFLAELEFLQELTHGDDRGFRDTGKGNGAAEA